MFSLTSGSMPLSVTANSQCSSCRSTPTWTMGCRSGLRYLIALPRGFGIFAASAFHAPEAGQRISADFCPTLGNSAGQVGEGAVQRLVPVGDFVQRHECCHVCSSGQSRRSPGAWRETGGQNFFLLKQEMEMYDSYQRRIAA